MPTSVAKTFAIAETFEKSFTPYSIVRATL
jgi:hypothetical protein